MASFTVSCIDCGEQEAVSSPKARYCRRCKLLRDLLESQRWYTRKKRCRQCREQFRPLRPKDIYLCGACEDAKVPASQQHAVTTSLCVNKVGDPPKPCGAAVMHGVVSLPICRGCLKHPVHQPKLVDRIKKGRSERRKTNHATLAAIAAGQPHIHRLEESP